MEYGLKGPVILYGGGLQKCRGSKWSFTPTERGVETVLAMVKVGGGGHNTFYPVLGRGGGEGGKVRTKFQTPDFPIL